MVKKVLKEILKKGVKKGKAKTKKVKFKSGEGTVNRGGAPEPGTVGARKVKTKTTPKVKTKAKTTGITKTKPKSTGIYRAKPKSTGIYRAKPKAAAGALPISLGAAGAGAKIAKTLTSGASKGAKNVSKGAIAGSLAALTGVAGLATLANKSNKAAKVTFGEAFKEARKKGEGTKFTWEGKKFTAVTKDDLKKKGYDDNELRQYANRKGKARGPLNRLGQKAKKVLLGKDKKFGGDKGLIDFIRKPKKKMGGGMANSKPAPKKYKAGGMATKGLGKAYMKSKR
tara:strand:+ start:69 stop:917 length:849 start_codon:yes stop_codon:yes gene_type:complete